MKSIFSALGTQTGTARKSARSTFGVFSSSPRSRTLTAPCVFLRISSNRPLFPASLFSRSLRCSGSKTSRSSQSVSGTSRPNLWKASQNLLPMVFSNQTIQSTYLTQIYMNVLNNLFAVLSLHRESCYDKIFWYFLLFCCLDREINMLDSELFSKVGPVLLRLFLTYQKSYSSFWVMEIA